MNDEQWMAHILAEAEPLDEKPGVRGIYFDRYIDALRILRILGARDSDGMPVLTQIKRMSPNAGRFFTGVARQTNIVITYAGGFWSYSDGERAAKLYLDIGSEKELKWMMIDSEEILNEYRKALAGFGQYPINNPYN